MQVNGISVAAAEAIQAASVVSGYIAPATGHLILVTEGGAEIDAGVVVQDTIDLATVELTGGLEAFNVALSNANFLFEDQNGFVVGSEHVFFKSSEEAVFSSTVLQTDNHLWFLVQAGGKYIFDGALFKTNASAGGGFKFAMTGPALTHLQLGVDQGFVWNYGDTINSMVDGTSPILGYIECSAGGIVLLEWAQVISDADHCILGKGSFIRVRRVG